MLVRLFHDRPVSRVQMRGAPGNHPTEPYSPGAAAVAPQNHSEAPSADETAWRLYMDLRENPCRTSALKLTHWLREGHAHPKALERALRLWALAGAALVVSRRRDLHPPTGGIE
ncbi:hypothetical protein VLK31_26820 [Variovorax sp. H27-G14]|uniref:hypothetical protein n=1 Tax=Variovorax sp. H27-G14 TaxID=3111914 RepID=UPI0038FC1C9D